MEERNIRFIMTEKNINNKNNGSIFVNNKKNSEKQPDYRGKATLNSENIRLSAWKNLVNNEERIDILGVSEEDFQKIIKTKNNEKESKPINEEEYFDPDIENIFKDFLK